VLTTDTIIRLGAWQPDTDRGAHQGHQVAAILDGTTTIGHLVRYGPSHYQARLLSPGLAGCRSAHNHTAVPVSGDGVYRPDEHREAHRFSSDIAALIAVARHHHRI
jgi:hypothetical protein